MEQGAVSRQEFHEMQRLIATLRRILDTQPGQYPNCIGFAAHYPSEELISYSEVRRGEDGSELLLITQQLTTISYLDANERKWYPRFQMIFYQFPLTGEWWSMDNRVEMTFDALEAEVFG